MQDRRHLSAVIRPERGGVVILVAILLSLARPLLGVAADGPSYPLLDIGDEVPSFALASPIGPIAYAPGRGLRLGDLPLTIGGYSNVSLVRDEGGPARLALDELSFFVIADPLPRIHLFAELELEDLLIVDDHGHGGTNESDYTTERLYGDLTVSDQLNVRVGKFLTPVGRWNVIHAQPLVWTTSRPLATSLIFDPHVTGAMVFGSVFSASGEIDYSLFGQFVDQFDPVPQPQPADRSGGARVEYTAPGGFSVGGSYQAFTSAGHWQHLGGLDTLWRTGPLELMGEFAYADSPHGPPSQWGLYLQTVLQLSPRFYLVGRYEHFDQRPPEPEVNLVILGLAFKPVPYVVVKAEYLIADHRAEESPPGLKSSVAILF